MFSEEFYSKVDELMASGRFGSRSEAAAEARRLRPDLVAGPTAGASPAAPGSARTTGNAGAELDRLARAIQREQSGLSYAQAYSAAVKQNASLYVQYLGERNGGRAGANA